MRHYFIGLVFHGGNHDIEKVLRHKAVNENLVEIKFGPGKQFPGLFIIWLQNHLEYHM